MCIGSVSKDSNSLAVCSADGVCQSAPAVSVDKEAYRNHPKTLALVSLPPYNGYIKAIKKHDMLARYKDDALFEMIVTDIEKSIESREDWDEGQKEGAIDYLGEVADMIDEAGGAPDVKVVRVYYDGWGFWCQVKSGNDDIMVYDHDVDGILDMKRDKIFETVKGSYQKVAQADRFQVLGRVFGPYISPMLKQVTSYIDDAAKFLRQDKTCEWTLEDKPENSCIKPGLDGGRQLKKFFVKEVINKDAKSPVEELLIYDFNKDKKADAVELTMRNGMTVAMNYAEIDDGLFCKCGITGDFKADDPRGEAIRGLRNYLQKFDD